MNYGTNLTNAKTAADANAYTFGIPYYVVQTTAGLYVERDKPADEKLIAYTALPTEKKIQDGTHDTPT